MLTTLDRDHGNAASDVVINPSARSLGIAGRVEDVRALIDELATTIGWAATDCVEDIDTADDANAIIEVTLRAIVEQLHDPSTTAVEHERWLYALEQLRHTQVMLQEAISARRADAMGYVCTAIDNLHQIETVAELVSRAPIEAGRLGFDRCLLSKISDARWVARSAYASGDRELADAMIDAGNRTPRLIDTRLVEYELVCQRKSMLVSDARHNDRVHPELRRLVDPAAYVVAPITARGSVVGFIHADAGEGAGPVDEFDRDLLDAFSTGLSIALESLYYREQLDHIRRYTESPGGPGYLLGDEPAQERGESQGQLPALPRSVLRSAGGVLGRLTRREIEVLTHMANGETNRRIAARLFVSEATVKAHVKHILRKLDAANRAEAVSRYFRAS